MRQLAYKGPPTPPNLGTLQGVGILKPVVIVSKVKDVGRYQRKKMNYKIALLAYLFDCVVVFFDLFSGKDHPLLCWIVPPPKDLC